MSYKEYDDPRETIARFKKWLTDYQKQQTQAQEVERKRRAALTPMQRAVEDRAKTAGAAQVERQKLTKKFAEMGNVIRKADTWTIADFCWLLLAESPNVDSWSFFDERSSKAAKQHREYCAIVESCVHTRLKPVNPTDAPVKHRFAVQSLVQVARDKRLGCVGVLADVIGLKNEPSPTAAATPAPASSGHSPRASVPPQQPVPQAGARRRQPRAAWYGVLKDVLERVAAGAQRLGRPLTRDSLPEGSKQLLPILREECERRKVPPPPKHGTLLKQVNAQGWAFGGPGVRETTGELRRLFDAG